MSSKEEDFHKDTFYRQVIRVNYFRIQGRGKPALVTQFPGIIGKNKIPSIMNFFMRDKSRFPQFILNALYNRLASKHKVYIKHFKEFGRRLKIPFIY